MFLYVPLGRYLGYNYGLQLDAKREVYQVNVTRFADFTNVISDRTFSLLKTEEAICLWRQRFAIAHAKELIELEVEPLLPY